MSDGAKNSGLQLVVHRVGATHVELWVGDLLTKAEHPGRVRLRLVDGAGEQHRSELALTEWRRPIAKAPLGICALRRFDELEPNQSYRVYLERQSAGGDDWYSFKRGAFRTLPEQLPDAEQPPLTVAFGSCFYPKLDRGAVATAYQALFEHGPAAWRPQLKFILGDLVYLDIGLDSLWPFLRGVRTRTAKDYARHFQLLEGMLAHGATWFLPDDHDYWNNYPYYDSWLPTLWLLRFAPRFRAGWAQAARDGVKNIQRSARVEIFDIGSELSFCLADLRSHRGERNGTPLMMTDTAAFSRLLEWARGLTSPGVLVTSQPLMVSPDREHNLLSYPEQYRQLVEALGHSGHDVVSLSGDVHFGRVGHCKLGPKGGRLFEILGSPLSNLTGISSVSTATPKDGPACFPDAHLEFSAWEPQPVTYTGKVPTQPGFWLPPYIRRRTKEHFATASFRRAVGGGVQLAAQSWLVRDRRGAHQLPAPAFEQPFEAILR